jgi:hypothetical protein
MTNAAPTATTIRRGVIMLFDYRADKTEARAEFGLIPQAYLFGATSLKQHPIVYVQGGRTSS